MNNFRRTYPDNGPIFLDGGLNNKFERSIIADNESPDCMNVVFSNGAAETRLGTLKLNTAAIGSFVGDGLYVRRARDNSETMCAFAGGTMWTLQGTSFTAVASSTSLFTAGVRVGAAQAENYLFHGNGGTIPYKWNGTEYTRHGVYPPTTTSTVASQATGLLTGDYRWKVTAVNSNSVESDVGPATATFTAASATARVTLPTFAVSYGVNARRLYRTEVGASVFKRVAEIANNTATTYDDNIPDASLGVVAPTDNGVPPKYNAIIFHQGRLFMNDLDNPNLVWWSEIGDPFTVASTNNKIIGDNTSDLVKGFAIHNDSLVVICENSIDLGYMPDTDDTTWKWVKTKSPYGSKSPYAPINVKNAVFFPAVQNTKFVGFANLDGESVTPSTSLLTVQKVGSDLVSDRIEPDMFNVQESYLGNISAIVFKNKAYIALTYGANQTTNNRFYVYDFSISNLTKDQKEAWVPNNGVSPAQFAIYGGKLYFISATANGFVYQMEYGVYSDDGVAINSYFYTKEFSGSKQDYNAQKDFRYADILVDMAGDYYMEVSYRTNSDVGSGNANQIYLNPGGGLWGSLIWGFGVWGGGSAQKKFRFPLGKARGERIQLKFSNKNTVNQRFKVHRMNLIYNWKGER